MKIEARSYTAKDGVETVVEETAFADWPAAMLWFGGVIGTVDGVRVFTDFRGDGEVLCVLEYAELGV